MRFAAAVLLLAFSTSAVWADDRTDAETLVTEAQATFRDFINDPDLTWFRDNVGRAKGILIVPQLVKAGFILGGSGGSGVLLTEMGDGRTWSYPAFYTMGSLTGGLQIGAEVAEVVMLVMTSKGLDAFLSTKVQLGADASVAAGPVGAGAQAATADVLQFSRAKGLFGGLTVEGAVVGVRDSLNKAYYGRAVRPVDILINHEVVNPQADALRGELASSLN